MVAEARKAPVAQRPKERPVLEMRSLQVEGVDIPFKIRADGAGPVLFSLGVRKSGSTMLHRIVSQLAARAGATPVDIPGAFFRSGLTFNHVTTLDFNSLIKPGNIYTGFRAFPTNLAKAPGYEAALKLFMFRDPRDALVSQYFSDAFSHSLPAGDTKGRELFLKKRDEAKATDINEWVLAKAGSLRRTLLGYQNVLKDDKTLILRYEDYVFQKRRMIRKIQAHFGWNVHGSHIDKIIEDIDFVPEHEDRTRFVRKAIPGDHTVKLSRETIQRLNNRLGDVLELYDY